ncbi:RapGAP/RanGAP domain-containing protein [Heterostelium album PN500]|uniref:RapGAP/RanGAP domain-containing protein n=1 Tax=Heterostelium pallidum (strain ATCC 26659 / Pp 5 / PN500) TaxID=670386 RepID=D3BQV8_HETP5|nr:RapGAP/RanGAP domain-containing protein [Heterostelium album PN500]EFA76528.1 RapGAP/RanGAP domain-containing protein [Heterostelium album PN500]|eukprot:XP_020428660.1 RapGAP/RanGAP domain-containing protein [Heterostelium album PN500]
MEYILAEGAESGLTRPSFNWRSENGQDTFDDSSNPFEFSVETPVIENPEECLDEITNDAFGASILKEETPRGEMVYKIIVWSGSGVERQMFQCKPKQTLTSTEIVKRAAPKLQFKKLKEVESTDILQDFKELESTQTELAYKFGIWLAKEGQSSEDQFYNNNEGSDRYKEFLKIMGDTVELKSFKGYRGGLDVTNNTTGSHSLFTRWMDYQIMFHVSTMLPHTPGDSQQIERKRHIGNDIVILIFYDIDPSVPMSTEFIKWDPSHVNSNFNHIFAVVKPENDDSYRLEFIVKNSIANFGPKLPFPSVFLKGESFKQFLLAKLVNGQRAALQSAPSFSSKLQRTFRAQLNSIYQKYTSNIPTASSLISKRRSLSLTYISKGMELKAKEFVNNSNLRVKDFSRNLFETEILFSKSFDNIICLDVIESEENNCILIFATLDSIYLFKNGGSSESSFQKVATLKGVTRLVVVKSASCILALNSKGLHVFDLEHLKKYFAQKTMTKISPDAASKLEEPKPKRIDGTKGCTVFAVSKNNNSSSRSSSSYGGSSSNSSSSSSSSSSSGSLDELCESGGLTINITLLYIAHKKNFIMYEWHNGEFIKSKDIQVYDNVKSICHVGPGMVCIGVAKEFLLIDMYTGTIKELYKQADSEPVKALSLDTEILLCFNNIGFFVDEKGTRTRNFDIKWGSIPSSIVLLPHYVLGISGQLIEVRTLLNGNIIQSLPTLQSSTNSHNNINNCAETTSSVVNEGNVASKVGFTTFNDMAHIDNGNIYVASSYKGTSCIIRIKQSTQLHQYQTLPLAIVQQHHHNLHHSNSFKDSYY